MNKTFVHCAFGILFLFLCNLTFAADLVKLPRGLAAWTIDVTPSPRFAPPPQPDNSNSAMNSSTLSSSDANSKSQGKAKNPPPTPDGSVHNVGKITVTQDKDKQHMQTKFTDGTSYETWSVNIGGSSILMSSDRHGNVFIGSTQAVPFGPDAFSWLKEEFLQEKKPIKYLGKKCFHYKTEILVVRGHSRDIVPHELWVDSETLLPVAFDDGDELGVYTFMNPPTTPLTLPTKFAKLAKLLIP